jgi:hypothetical protein
MSKQAAIVVEPPEAMDKRKAVDSRVGGYLPGWASSLVRDSREDGVHIKLPRCISSCLRLIKYSSGARRTSNACMYMHAHG